MSCVTHRYYNKVSLYVVENEKCVNIILLYSYIINVFTHFIKILRYDNLIS